MSMAGRISRQANDNFLIYFQVQNLTGIFTIMTGILTIITGIGLEAAAISCAKTSTDRSFTLYKSTKKAVPKYVRDSFPSFIWIV